MQEYWDAYLKNQSKRRLELFANAVKKFNAEITDQYQENYFRDSWRNPMYAKIRLKAGQRWNFILECQCQVILERPPRVGFLQNVSQPLAGNHDQLRLHRVRTYRLHPSDHAYVKDHVLGVVLHGSQNVVEVLEGNLDLLRQIKS